ncbi:group II intron maturase-specific domain-containing protein [Flexithrix dorotheae]|uniref:group II intron maturase-specific domain-containing protein n=1 Tax=Flexithrix dorotheae TaxID=70993 RepID=UPI00036F7CCD|nr:group II intron maturase-specific domain-containing protein [Flexithrix dorotheae]
MKLPLRRKNCGPIKTHGLNRRPTSLYKINFIRYCDDFIVTASMKEVLEEKVIPAIKAFLEPRGLILSERKTKITHIETGFDFLGQNIRKYGTKLLITPSKYNLQSLFTKIKTIFGKMKAASAWALIRKLNPILKGWAYYHRHIVAKATYNKVDYFIFLKLRRWLKRKHPDKSWNWINRKYYHHPYSGKSQFFDRGKDNEVVTLI